MTSRPPRTMTPEEQRFKMESTMQEKEKLAERVGLFHHQMQEEMESLILLEQDLVRQKYFKIFEHLVEQTDIALVLEQLDNRTLLDEFDNQISQWEETELTIKIRLESLQRMLLGEFDESQNCEPAFENQGVSENNLESFQCI